MYTKPKMLNQGDKVAIVSLSRGLLGEEFCKHELEIGLKRLKEFGLIPVIMPNSLKVDEYLRNHPEERANDLKEAFLDDDVKGIITSVGGDDTYKIIPYLMEDKEFIEAVRNNPKIFIGYSDTTNNHLMLNKLGLSTFYGPCLLTDLAELDKEMLPYTKEYFNKLFMDESSFEIKSSPIWYNDRDNFGVDEVGKPRKSNKETHGYEILNGEGTITGKLYGGCIEIFYDIFTGYLNKDAPFIYNKYNILPSNDEWQEKILFLETSELKITPEELEKMLLEFKKRNIFNLVKGIIVGKPYDEVYYEEYKEVYRKVFKDLNTPILYNVNFGHAFPRCIIPYDAEAVVDYDNKKIFINSKIFENDNKCLKK